MPQSITRRKLPRRAAVEGRTQTFKVELSWRTALIAVLTLASV
jgi:hypothetical protein